MINWLRPRQDDVEVDLEPAVLAPVIPRMQQVENFHDQHIRERHERLEQMYQRERRLEALSAELAEDLRRTRLARHAEQAAISIIEGGEYDPAKDGAKSYEAAIHAKRERGDTHYSKPVEQQAAE